MPASSRKVCSPSHRAYCLGRKRNWVERQKDRQALFPADKIWLLDRVCNIVDMSRGQLSMFAKVFLSHASETTDRQREIYPLPGLLGDSIKPECYTMAVVGAETFH